MAERKGLSRTRAPGVSSDAALSAVGGLGVFGKTAPAQRALTATDPTARLAELAVLLQDLGLVSTAATLVAAAAGGGTVPYFVPAGGTYSLAANQQALYSVPIELDTNAILDLEGILAEV